MEDTNVNRDAQLEPQPVEVIAKDEIRIRSSFGMKSKDETKTGKRRVPGERFVGDDYHEKSKKWNTKVRIIDRVNDWYYEEVRYGDTGTVIHLCNEPLSEHCGHGSAKRPKKAGTRPARSKNWIIAVEVRRRESAPGRESSRQ